MNRRGVFHALAATVATWAGAARAAAGEAPASMKVVYHLSDFDKAVSFSTTCAFITKTPAIR